MDNQTPPKRSISWKRAVVLFVLLIIANFFFTLRNPIDDCGLPPLQYRTKATADLYFFEDGHPVCVISPHPYVQAAGYPIYFLGGGGDPFTGDSFLADLFQGDVPVMGFFFGNFLLNILWVFALSVLIAWLSVGYRKRDPKVQTPEQN